MPGFFRAVHIERDGRSVADRTQSPRVLLHFFISAAEKPVTA